MGIDAKDVGILFWKILRFSTNTIYTYVKKYPVFSGVSAVIFLLYTFLPFLFYLVLYSSPFIACSAFYLRNHPSFKPLKITASKTVNGLSPSSRKGSERGIRKVNLKHQRSVRRNARRKVEEVGKDWDCSQASEDERDKVILTTLYGEFPNTKKSPKLEKFKKDLAFLVSEEFSFKPSLDEETPSTTVVDLSEMLTSGGGETEIDCSSSSEGEEESSREDKKVVAWTEDDQKNLMDLGNSEMERNKRLEHLISRRRTRRLFLLAAEKSLMDMEVPSICIGRKYFGLDQENYIIDGIQIPESAPCVLLPRRNPFDLPYDPQEEKPNLSGDSFQQEFSEDNPNDIFFCHHESFCRRIFPSEIQLDSKLEPWEKTIDGWPRPLQANDMESEHKTETGVGDSNSLLSPGNSGQRNGDHRVGNSIVGLVPRNSGSLSSSLVAERQRYMEHFGYSSRKGHKLTNSAESDLLVEVSETGSPPTTVDGNNSSESDEEKVDQDLNETSSIVSPENDVAKQFESLSDGRSEEEERSISEEAIVLDTNEVTSQREEESQEMQGIVEAEASDVNDVTSGNSPRSVLPEMTLPLEQSFTFPSENLELTSDSQSPQNQLGGYTSNSRESEGQSESGEEAIEEDSTSDAIVPLVLH